MKVLGLCPVSPPWIRARGQSLLGVCGVIDDPQGLPETADPEDKVAHSR